MLTIQGISAAKDQQITALAPRAEAWDELASAEGDYSVADAAKILARAGVKTGPQRLFEQLAGIRWVHLRCASPSGDSSGYASASDRSRRERQHERVSSRSFRSASSRG